MKAQLVKGATDVIQIVFIQDSSSSTGAGLTGLVFNSAGLTCYYVRPGSVAAQLSLVTQTITGAHDDGGFVEIDAANLPGFYRLDFSDAICAAGVDSVGMMLKGATDMVPLPLEIQLTTQDLNVALNDFNPATDTVIVSEIQASGVDDMFSVDSGNTYAGSVAGSVVKEIADNVSCGGAVGAIEFTYTVVDALAAPVEGADIWISTDLAGTNVIWSGVTNSFGVAVTVAAFAKPFLDPGTYYFWVQKTGFTPASYPDAETVS